MRELLALILAESPLENHRPSWLFGMELDLYFERCRVAFEFQGDQHFEPGIFGDARELTAQRARDSRKVELCKAQRIHLCHVTAAELTLRSLHGKLAWRRKVWNRLRRLKLIRDLLKAQSAAVPISRDAQRYRAILQTKFDSASSYRGPARQAALVRHARALPP